MYVFLILFGCQTINSDTAIHQIDDENIVEWQISLENDSRGAFLSTWSSSQEDVWVVGGFPNDGIVLRGNHESGWIELELPQDTPLLNWVHGTSATDVWVGGLSGTILHWDGSDWENHSQEVEEAIWGIFVTDEQEVVAVGGESKWGGSQGHIWKYDGMDWTSISLPQDVSDVSNLFKVSYDGLSYWIVGVAGTLLYGDIENLTAIPTGFATDLITVSPSPIDNQVLIVGGRGTGIYSWAENGNLLEQNQAIAGLNGVFVAETHALMVGEMGYSLLLDQREESSIITEPFPTTRDILHATTGVEYDDSTVFYAVGGNLAAANDDYHGVLLTLQVPK